MIVVMTPAVMPAVVSPPKDSPKYGTDRSKDAADYSTNQSKDPSDKSEDQSEKTPKYSNPNRKGENDDDG